MQKSFPECRPSRHSPRHVISVCLSLVSLLAGCTSPTAASDAAVPDTASKIFQVPLSIVADCSVDVTGELQKWIASVPDTSTLVFGKQACYNVDAGLVVTDRRALTIDGNGSTFRVVSKGSSNRSNWTIRGGSDITLRNMTARGANPQAGITPTAYDGTVEWQHAYRFEGTQTGTLDNVQGYDVYGDFVEVQPDWTRVAFPGPPARNITVRNSHFERNGRQGVGLTHVDGFVLQDSYFGDINMTGIDIEPGDPRAMAKNIRLEHNTFGRVRHAILAAYGADAGNVSFLRNVMADRAVTCVPAVYIGAPAGAFWSGFTFEDNTLSTVGAALDLTRLKGVTIRNNTISAASACGNRFAAILVTDSHGGQVSDNAVTKVGPNPPRVYSVFQSDSLTTQFTVVANTMQ